MTLTNRKEQKRRLRCLRVDAEDGSPSAIRLRDVALYAASEPGSVAGFGLTRTKRSDCDAVHLDPTHSRLDRRFCRVAQMPKILVERRLVDPNREARLPSHLADG